MADRLLTAFPTLILQRRLEGMEETNRQLEALVAQIAATEPNSTTGTTTEGGFQTKEDLFQRDNPGIAALKPHIFSAMQEYAGQLVRQEFAQLSGRGRVGQDGELLDVGIAMTSALELEVALAERTARAEQLLGPLRDRGTRADLHGRLDARHRAEV